MASLTTGAGTSPKAAQLPPAWLAAHEKDKAAQAAFSGPSGTGTSPRIVSAELAAAAARAKALGIKPWMSDFLGNLPELPHDNTSNAEPSQVVTTHLEWNVKPDFEKQQLIGTATYTFNNKVGADKLMLDATDLEIERVCVNGEEAHFEIRKSQIPNKQDALCIDIPAKKGLGGVSIRYRTSPKATGIFWVNKEQTHGKKHPLVYTIFQPSAGASAIPGQHTTQVRLTYNINAHTGSPDLMALSSVKNNPKFRSATGDYEGLTMDRAVPLYLLSLQVGNFACQPYDKVTGVYSEEGMIADVAKSFAELPNIMKAAEEICGPYKWGTYTPVLLPWAFPYTAMEHPCASTCGQICMERLFVLPHELAHSWAGNDVTGVNRDFFWNEGLTTHLEYKICKKIWGPDYAGMQMMNTLKEMRSDMDEYRGKRPDF